MTPWWRMSRQKKQAFSGDDNERVWSEKRNTFHWRNPTWVHHVIKPTLIRLRDFGRIQSGSNLEKGVWTWKNYREKLRAPPFRYMIVQREVFFVRYQTAEGQSKSRRSKIQTTLEWNSKHNDSKFCESKPKLSSQLLREFFAFNHHRCWTQGCTILFFLTTLPPRPGNTIMCTSLFLVKLNLPVNTVARKISTVRDMAVFCRYVYLNHEATFITMLLAVMPYPQNLFQKKGMV